MNLSLHHLGQTAPIATAPTMPVSITVPGEGTALETSVGLGMAVFIGLQGYLLWKSGSEHWKKKQRIIGAVGYAGAITSFLAAGSGVITTFLRR